MHQKSTVRYRGAVYLLIEAEETEEPRKAIPYYRMTEKQREAVDKLMELNTEAQSIETKLVELLQEQIQLQEVLDKKDKEKLKAEAANGIKTLDKIEALQKRYKEILDDYTYKVQQAIAVKKEGSVNREELLAKIEDALEMDCELIEDQPLTENQLTQRHPAGAESPNATLYPLPLRNQHRGDTEKRKTMAKDPIIPDEMVKHDQKTETVETSGKGESTDDKGWQSTVEKNVEKIAEKGSEKTAMPKYLMYKGRRYAKVER